jgi:hypothetical protein
MEPNVILLFSIFSFSFGESWKKTESKRLKVNDRYCREIFLTPLRQTPTTIMPTTVAALQGILARFHPQVLWQYENPGQANRVSFSKHVYAVNMFYSQPV